MPDVVANSTPIIALAKIGRLDLLRPLYGEVAIPRAVYDEVTAKEDAAAQAVDSSVEWLLVEDAPEPDAASLLRARLHAGEVETIMLARRDGAALVVIDDNAAKRTARYLGLPVTGTLGVIVAAKRAGLLDSARDAVADLREIGFYMSDVVVDMALAAAGE